MSEHIDLKTEAGCAAIRALGLPVAAIEPPAQITEAPSTEPASTLTRALAERATDGAVLDTGRIEFCGQCGMYGLPHPEFEFRFAPPRRWRFDIAFPTLKIALEQQGGLFTGGRHVRGAALLKEYEKLNHAALFGWRVFFFSPGQIANGTAARFVARVLGGE